MAGKKISITECYKILQLSQNSSMAEVKQAYRKRAFELHPDLNPDSASANQNFQNLNEAYVIIIEHLNLQELKNTQEAEQTTQYNNSAEKEQKAKQTWSQRVWSQKSQEEKLRDEQKEKEERIKKEAERQKKEAERRERIERERIAEERYRAKERAAREFEERNRLREKIAQDNQKRKIRQQEEAQKRAKREEAAEERERARVLRQMEEEAQRNRETTEQKTRAYSHIGKPIFDQEKYKSTSTHSDKNSDFFTHSNSQNITDNAQEQKAKSSSYTTDDEMREQILKELLEDDYARKVYEDIYHELHARKEKDKKENLQDKTHTESVKTPPKKTVTAEYVRSEPQKAPLTKKITQQIGQKIQQVNKSAFRKTKTDQLANTIKQGISSWFKTQFDDELELFLPASKLIAGAKMRLQIRTGWVMNESHTVELTLPADFVPGKPFRLKGMGKKIGKWQGDLYLKLQVKEGK